MAVENVMKTIGTLLLVTFLAGCAWRSGHQMLSDVTFEKYSKSECAKWIAIPPAVHNITVYGFFGFDTNYRYLKCTFDQPISDLADFLMQSIASQPRQTNDTFILVRDASITLEEMQAVFGGFPGSVPQWWRTDLARFDQQAYCAWDTNHYGYGYIYLLDSKQKELRSFQWSQQHNTAAVTAERLGQ